MNTFLPTAYLQNQFLPFAEANLSIATHGLHHGTGAVGGLRGMPNPQSPQEILLFGLEHHCQRLSHASGLGIASRLHQLEKDLLVYGLYLDDSGTTAVQS